MSDPCVGPLSLIILFKQYHMHLCSILGLPFSLYLSNYIISAVLSLVYLYPILSSEHITIPFIRSHSMVSHLCWLQALHPSILWRISGEGANSFLYCSQKVWSVWMAPNAWAETGSNHGRWVLLSSTSTDISPSIITSRVSEELNVAEVPMENDMSLLSISTSEEEVVVPSRPCIITDSCEGMSTVMELSVGTWMAMPWSFRAGNLSWELIFSSLTRRGESVLRCESFQSCTTILSIDSIALFVDEEEEVLLFTALVAGFAARGLDFAPPIVK